MTDRITNDVVFNLELSNIDLPVEMSSQETNINERVKINYTSDEKKILNKENTILLIELELLENKKKSIIYPNQDACSKHIVSKLHNRKIINVLVIALTQSGKTGTMNGLLKNYLQNTTNTIPVENIYIITGLSSVEWVEQTKNRLPNCINNRVYHRDKLLSEFIKDIKDKKNVLVIMDEIQIAAKEKQSLYKSFKKAGFYDKKYLLENDIKIVEFTATPDGTIYDIDKWKARGCKIKMTPGEGYTSCFNLMDSERVYPYRDLCCFDSKNNKLNKKEAQKNINLIKSIIETKYSKPIYHIIRTPNGDLSDIVISNFKSVFNDDNIKYCTYDGDSDMYDINDKYLKVEPQKHTFIFIKEKLRCAKTLHKQHLGILYDRYTKSSPDDAVIIQGLLGRATGYDDNGETIIFTNLDSIKKYEQLWNTNFEDKSVKWKSKTTKFRNKNLSSIGTYTNGDLVDGLTNREDINQDIEPIIKKFNTFKEAYDYVKNELGNKQGPRKLNEKNKTEDGFYKNHIRGKWNIMSYIDVVNNKKWGITPNDNNYRFHVCYENVNDKSTEKHIIIHYPIKST